MQHAKLFLNKVIEEKDITALSRYNITADDMHSETDRNTFDFLQRYTQENGGEVPSYAVVADSVKGFEYIPEVSDSYKYLARKVKDFSAQKAVVDWFKVPEGQEMSEFERELNDKGGLQFLN